jgi:hypothetical protein
MLLYNNSGLYAVHFITGLHVTKSTNKKFFSMNKNQSSRWLISAIAMVDIRHRDD